MEATVTETLLTKIPRLPLPAQEELLRQVEGLLENEPCPPTIWEKIRAFAQNVPHEEWQKVPPDGAEQHDHYLYGTLKR